MAKEVRALSLFSGGLDSILATRLVAAQGIEIIAVKFVSPFFDYSILADRDAYIARVREKYGITVLVEDISEAYLNLLHNPSHGVGKNFNPCIDCKIMMLKRARRMMTEYGASFLITGEVVGQRPMSQRRDTLNVIERDSGSRSFLLRPLSAKLLKETDAELQGLVDRDRLLDFSGRGRARQIALAKEFDITDFPAPAGGCSLADPILSKRIADLYSGNFVIRPENISIEDILCLMTGRQFVLPGGGWLVLGRDEGDNDRLMQLRKKNDIMLRTAVYPGPTALLRYSGKIENEKHREDDIAYARGLVVRYAKKIAGRMEPQTVEVHSGDAVDTGIAAPIAGKEYQEWMI